MVLKEAEVKVKIPDLAWAQTLQKSQSVGNLSKFSIPRTEGLSQGPIIVTSLFTRGLLPSHYLARVRMLAWESGEAKTLNLLLWS